MSSQDQRFWITFNGEIYHYVELRQELMAMGAQFRSHSDTEVLIVAYAQWRKGYKIIMHPIIRRFLKRVFPQFIVQRIQQRNFQQQLAHFQPYLVTKQIGDITLDFWIADPVGQLWYDGKVAGKGYEMEFMRDRMLTAGDVVFECGAHHGMTTMLLAKWVGDTGQVVAFEASRHNYDILKRNIALNQIGNIEAHHAAVGDTPGRVKISIDYNVNVSTDPGGEFVEMVTLDTFQDANPAFIKIDVEGFEGAVLKGALAILRRKPKLAIEVHTEWLRRYNSSLQDIFECIDLKYYEIYIQWDENEPPQPYHQENITQRVHLFFLPR